MKKINLLILLCIGFFLAGEAQQKNPGQKKTEPKKTEQKIPALPQAFDKLSDKKYPSLLWEITGNGLQRPSYLFGTMHVSDKLAFHLGDSFYNAIKNVQMVALETNPEFWQDDYSKSAFFNSSSRFNFDNFYFSRSDYPSDFLKIGSFAFGNYDEAIKAALAVEPSLINGLLYRTYGNNLDDFEEDTYVDMYIFQTGKKLGKKVTGVENFEESEKLVIEAYKDMYKDRNRKKKSYDYEDMFTNPKKVEDAYRKGDLDLMDSLDALNVTSDAFEEKFLYKRNDIQAHSIDTILKKSSLFVAVGAAHLPGRRGVIELLRAKGYKLRPVKMDDRNSIQKDAIDKMRTPVAFVQQASPDSFYNVSIPGKKFYRFTDWQGLDVVQYADMVNGAYYVVTRIKTNSLYQGFSNELVHRKIDTLLYENIPGKILKKTPVTKNGYKGWEIINRTRRGDYQRYNIFVTPFEVIVFKMSGNGEYIKSGTEAQQFFGSIKMKPYEEKSWINFQPATGGFSVQLPHVPLLMKDAEADRLDYAAYDKTDQNSYLVMQINIHNYGFAEADSFDLDLMDESYASSDFINKQLSHERIMVNGYPALLCKYLHRDGSFSTVKYVLRGPVYYAAAVHYKNEDENAKKFLSSFAVTSFIYPETKLRTDTTLHITVESPLYPPEKKKETNTSPLSFYGYFSGDDDDYSYADNFKSKYVGNDTIGEKIFVSYTRPGDYLFVKDSAKFWKRMFSDESFADESEEDSTYIFKLDKKYDLPGGIKCRERQFTDTASSRLIWTKWLYKDGHMFTISTLTDTLSSKNPFLQKFFDSFRPADSLKGESIFTRKSQKFFDNFFSKDSVTAKKARRAMDDMNFDSLDVPLLENAINRMNWDMKDYIDTKKHFITELGYINDPSATVFLKQLYFRVKDTADLQNTILKALLSQETKTSFAAFRDIMLKEPPISDDNSSNFRDDWFPNSLRLLRGGFGSRIKFRSIYNSGDSWPELYDTLELTKTIFPDFLQMLNLDDYKDEMIRLMTTMVDSGFLKGSDYEPYYNKFYMEARQLLKKQIAKEDEDNIDRATRKKNPDYDEDDEDGPMDDGNSRLENFSVLLMPFYNEKDAVRAFFDQLLKTKDQRLLYNTFLLMLRNNKPVPDSLFMTWAKLDEYRSELYADLKKIKKLDKFPAAYKNQLELAKSLLQKDSYSYEKLDSLTFLDKLPATYKDKKGWVYFFKYKKMRDDNFWELGSVGMQPEKLDSIDIDNDDFTQADHGKLETDKPVGEQLQRMLKELLNSKRLSAWQFYDDRGSNYYKTYLSEMVKSERYHD